VNQASFRLASFWKRKAAMAYGDENDLGWCNIIVKFLLFLTNLIIWVSECG